MSRKQFCLKDFFLENQNNFENAQYYSILFIYLSSAGNWFFLHDVLKLIITMPDAKKVKKILKYNSCIIREIQ